MKRSAWWAFAGLMIVLSLFQGECLAAQPLWPEIQVEAAWGARTRNAWSELRVTVTQGGGAWHGDLIIYNLREEITYRVPLELPAQTHKVYRVPVFVGESSSIRLALRDAQNNEKTVQNLAFVSVPDEQRFCVVASDQSVSLSHLCDALVYLERPDALPEWIPAWDSVDVLFWDGVSTADLTSAQQQALVTWVSMGGQFIAGGGDALRLVLEGLPPLMHIATVSGPALTLDAFPLPDAPARPWIVAPLQKATDEAQILMTLEDGRAVALGQTLGMGEVVIIGTRAGLLTHTDWLEALIKKRRVPAIVVPLVEHPWGRASTMGYYPSAWTLTQFPRNALPPQGLIFCLAPVVYILLMGPLAWIVVRRTHRPLLAWLLLPAITLIFVSGIFVLLNITQIGVFPLEHTISLFFVPDARVPARAIHYTAFYAPQWHRFAWDTARWTRPWLGAYHTSYPGSRGEFFPVEVIHQSVNSHVEMRDLGGVVTWVEEEVVAAPSFHVEMSIIPDGNGYTFRATVSNAQPFKDVYFIWGTPELAYEIASTLPAGENINFNRRLMPSALPSLFMEFFADSEPTVYYGGPPELKQSSSGDMSSCFIIATSNHPGMGQYALIGKGRQAHDRIWIYRVPCPSLAFASETLVVPPSQWLISSSDIQIEEGKWIYLNPYQSVGTVEYVTYLPVEFGEIETLKLELMMRYGSKPADVIRSIEVYDWKADTWVELPGTLLTEGAFTFEGDEALRFIGPELSHIKVRVYNRALATGSAEQVSLSLTLSGKP